MRILDFDLVMSLKLLRLAYVCEFLLALVAIFTGWSEIGGQATLDLMHWSFKLVFSLALAGSVVAWSAAIIKEDALWTLRSARWFTAIIVLLCAMAAITVFYALQVESGDSDESTSPHHAISSSFGTS
jgi:hypothetical protein